jgi:ATP adenylyltransferase
MEHIWTPWRYKYVVSTAEKPQGCVFCVLPSQENDEANLIVHRGESSFVILNLFPYSTGHVLIVPYAHEHELTALDDSITNEMMTLSKRCQRILQKEYKPDGFNMGFNLGRCAGAGVADHLHMHVVPRWIADANFMFVIGEAKLMPEELNVTRERLSNGFLAGL